MSAKGLTIQDFSENFLNWCIKSYDSLCTKNLDEKLVENHYFQDFETKKPLQIFSENLFFVQLKKHHLPQKFFQNVFSSLKIRSSKLKYASSQKSSFSSSSNRVNIGKNQACFKQNKWPSLWQLKIFQKLINGGSS